MSEDAEVALPPKELRHIADYWWVLVNYDFTPHVAVWDPKEGFTDDAAPSGVAVCQERVLSPEEVAALRAERDALFADRELHDTPAWQANERLNAAIDAQRNENDTLQAEIARMREAIDEEVRCLGHLQNELRGRLEGDAATKFFPVVQRAIMRLVEAQTHRAVPDHLK